MGIVDRCELHGFVRPCTPCIIQEGWEEHGGKGPMPGRLLDKAMAQAHGAMEIHHIPMPEPPPPIAWHMGDGHWVTEVGVFVLTVDLADKFEWAIHAYGTLDLCKGQADTLIEAQAAAKMNLLQYLAEQIRLAQGLP